MDRERFERVRIFIMALSVLISLRAIVYPVIERRARMSAILVCAVVVAAIKYKPWK
jgi:hypothetical protein